MYRCELTKEKVENFCVELRVPKEELLKHRRILFIINQLDSEFRQIFFNLRKNDIFTKIQPPNNQTHNATENPQNEPLDLRI